MRVLIALLLLAATAQAQPPALSPPLGVPMTTQRVELGRMLYHDERLSIDGSVSCATCHNPEHGFSDGLSVSVGIRGQTGVIHAPTTLNAAYSRFQFWNGRTDGMATQSLQPLVNPVEMGNGSLNQVLNRLRNIPGYVKLFNEAYGYQPQLNRAIDRDRFGHAMASFQFTLVSSEAPIDRRMRGDLNALSPKAEIGYGLFVKADCMSCHKPPLFSDLGFHNNGMEFAGKSQVTDNGLFTTIRNRNGFNQAQRQAAVRAFKTPSLRDVGRRAPYSHTGTFLTLHRVLQHYNAGGAKLAPNGAPVVDANVDRRVRRLGYTEYQLDCLEMLLIEGMASDNFPNVTRPVLP